MPIDASEDQLAQVTYNADGLVPAIVQDAASGEVLMMAWMNDKTLRLTLDEGRTVFWSRSRQEVWHKGATSGDYLEVRSIKADCEFNSLLVRVKLLGKGTCHTGAYSCFFNEFPETVGA